MSRPKYLVIGPGAMAFYTFLGRLSCMDLSQVRAVSGSSAGALLALLWIIHDGDVYAILKTATSVKVDQLMKPNIKNFLSNFGLVPISKMRHVLTEFIFKKFKVRDLTFGELWNRRPVKLYVSAFCTERGQTVYFSHETHPGTSVIDAVCASIAVPLLFSTVKIGEWRYVDGGYQEEIPGLPFVDKDPADVIAICIDQPPVMAPSNSMGSYMATIFAGILRLRHKYNFPSYIIDSMDIDIFDFSADGLSLFVKGQKSMNLVNETHYPVGLYRPTHVQDDPREGDPEPQGVLVPPQAGLYPRETGPDL